MQKLMYKTYGARMEYLYDRWQDEKKHEDFNDYKLNLKKLAKSAGHRFVSLTQRPFVLTVRVEDEEYAMKATSTQILISV